MAQAKKKVAPAPAPAAAESEAPRAPRGHPDAEQVITLLVDHNPKRLNSASHARFENYEDGMTVEEALAAGVVAGDIAWDVKHDFIKLGDELDKKVVKRGKPEPKARAPKEDAAVAEKPGKGKAKPEVEDEEDEDEAPAPAPKRTRR